MAVRASLLPYIVGLAATGLTLGACGDDGGSAGTEGASGSTTQGTSADTENNPTTNSATMGSTLDGTGTDTSSPETDDDSSGDTTGEPPVGCPYDAVDGEPAVTLELVGRGFDRPMLAIGHPVNPGRLFVVEQGGNVRILEPGETEAPADAFLNVDVRGANSTDIGPEYGLLGFAFHPNFPEDPRVYVNYNPPTGGGGPMHTIVSEFTVDEANPDQVDPSSERVILDLEQPATNHNGGMIMFGQDDGYLYIGMGDGGGGGDTFNTGRAPEHLLAKVLRIDVEPDGTPDNPTACTGCDQFGPFDYTIPADNPFVGDAAFAPEIYAWGVRNPWRFSQDSETGLIYAGDVGQEAWEEVTLIEAGRDYGWSSMEGFHCFEGGAGCDESPGPNEVGAGGMTMPIAEYSHGGGRCSITGGAVYHSCQVPAWDGVYFYADFCSTDVFGLVWDGAAVTELGSLLNSGEFITGSGWNAWGDVFLTTVDVTFGFPIEDGLVYRLAPAGA